MPEVQVSFLLPSFLRVAAGEYDAGEPQARVEVVAPELVEGLAPRTQVRARFTHPDTTGPNEIQRCKTRDADQLLWSANRLLRWYRAVTYRADMVEVTRAQASPFQFAVVTGAAGPEWAVPLQYEDAGPPPLDMVVGEITEKARAGFASGREPDVADLFLLDAERALAQGRFRETVLFCWSTIDSVFNRKYDALVGAVLAEEWAAAREFFTGVDFGLRNKMTAALYLVARHSLYRQPGDFWQRLTVSYTKRNAVIHRGETANEDEARQAIAVARDVVSIMDAIPAQEVGSPAVPAPGPGAPPPPPQPQEAPNPPGPSAATRGRKKKGK